MRARNIKPGIFKNELLGTADPLLTILFEGLWTLADREGRLEDRPLRIKAEIFPYRESLDINGSLTVLVQMGFVERYEVADQKYIQVVNFRKHQTPHKTEKPSNIPPKPLENKTTGSASVIIQKLDEKITAPLPPDSLTPDSPYSDTNVSGEASPPEIDFKKIIFDQGLEFVSSRSGKTTATLRPLFGKWCRDHGEARVAAAIVEAHKTSAVDPVSWIVKFLEGGVGSRSAAPRSFAKQDYSAGLEGFHVVG